MNRRHFLRATAAAVGALTLDPERLLWVPGQRTYFDIHRPGELTVEMIRRIVDSIGGLPGGGESEAMWMSRALYVSLGGDVSRIERVNPFIERPAAEVWDQVWRES